MTDHITLLRESAEQFRDYAQQHKNKVAHLADPSAIEQTLAKAAVNVGFAERIEKHLALEAVRLPDSDGPTMPEIAPMSHPQMVAMLQKSGEAILLSLTPLKADMLHMALGVCGKAGELGDAIKRWAIYGKELDFANVVEELGDLEFFMEGLRAKLNITRDETLAANIDKLVTSKNARYKDGYSDEAAIARADKAGDA